jgi:hypothetical protein
MLQLFYSNLQNFYRAALPSYAYSRLRERRHPMDSYHFKIELSCLRRRLANVAVTDAFPKPSGRATWIDVTDCDCLEINKYACLGRRSELPYYCTISIDSAGGGTRDTVDEILISATPTRALGPGQIFGQNLHARTKSDEFFEEKIKFQLGQHPDFGHCCWDTGQVTDFSHRHFPWDTGWLNRSKWYSILLCISAILVTCTSKDLLLHCGTNSTRNILCGMMNHLVGLGYQVI